MAKYADTVPHDCQGLVATGRNWAMWPHYAGIQLTDAIIPHPRYGAVNTPVRDQT